jgi:hypothetical protein
VRPTLRRTRWCGNLLPHNKSEWTWKETVSKNISGWSRMMHKEKTLLNNFNFNFNLKNKNYISTR